MRLGPWVVVVPVLLAILAGGVVMAVRAAQLGAFGYRWERCGAWRCRGAADALPRVEAAAERALRCLEVPSPEAAQVRATTGVHVLETDTVTVDGRTVSGVTVGTDVSVGHDLQALAHEFAHVLDVRRTGTTALGHDSPAWVGPGGWYARLSCYEDSP